MSTVADVRKAIEDDGEKLTGDIYSDFRKQTDATIDQWLANNYESLKDYKYLGPVARNAMVSLNEANNKEGEGKPQSLLAKYGLSPDYRAPNHWGKLSKTQLERLARESKYKDYEAFKQALWDESKAFEREKVWQDFKQEHPIINFIAESFFPNTYEGTKRIVESGEGEESDLYDDAIEDYFLGVASSINPVGKLSKFGTMGRTIYQGLWSGAVSALNEYSQYHNYDKKVDPVAILTGAGLGSSLEFVSAKKAGNALKGLFPENPTAKKAANKFEHAFSDVGGEAVDYNNKMKGKIKTFNDPVNNPASSSYVRTTENALTEGVTEQDAKLAKEAEQLFEYVKNGKKPVKEKEVFVKIDPSTGRISQGVRPVYYSDKEISDMFIRHPQLNAFDVMVQGLPKTKGKRLVGQWKDALPAAYHTARTGAVGKINAARTLEADTEHSNKMAEDKSKDVKLITKWQNGDIPTSGADVDYKAFALWGKKNPQKLQDAIAMHQKKKAVEDAYSVDFRFAGGY